MSVLYLAPKMTTLTFNLPSPPGVIGPGWGVQWDTELFFGGYT